MMEEWNGMEKEEDHPWVFLLDTIKRIAGILDSLLPHLSPTPDKWNQIVVENLKKIPWT